MAGTAIASSAFRSGKNRALLRENLKFGLTNNSDLQIVVSSFNYVRQQSSGNDSKQSGFGDILLRLKVNLFGNDSGSFAVAVMPYIKLPTNQGGISNC